MSCDSVGGIPSLKKLNDENSENLNLKPYNDSSLTDINEITSNNQISAKKITKSFQNIVSGDFIFQEASRENFKKEIINLNVK